MKASSSHRSATGVRDRRSAHAALPFRKRPAHNANHPVHVTLRVTKDIPSLRRDDLFDWIRHSIAATNQSECPRLGAQSFRIVEFSVQSNHIHYRNSFGVDPYSSAPYFGGYADEADDEERWIFATRKPPSVHAPRTWLLSTGWRKYGLVKRNRP